MGIIKTVSKLSGIKNVQFMGVTNQIVDTKLHALFNWQEDIQANVYSFFVTYNTGATETIQTYDKREINYYMNLVNRTNQQDPTPVTEYIRVVQTEEKKGVSSNTLDELAKLQELYEKGIVPEELYQTKKAALIEELSTSVNSKPTIENNVFVNWVNERNSYAEIVIFIDDEQRYDIKIRENTSFYLEPGTHKIIFKNRLIKSNAIRLNIEGNNDRHYITLKTDAFSIVAEIN